MTLEGGDESQWQGSVDWDAVKASGRSFEICKATEGNGFVDPEWGRNRSEMLRVGIPFPGAYHFSRPDLGNPPDAEADFWLNVVNPGPGWILAHDAESAGGSLAWCDEFERHCGALLGGYHVWFYSFLDWMRTRGIVGSDLLTRSPLWFAWPDSNGGLPFAAAIQQYGAGGLTGGDLNRFFGDASQLAALALGGGDDMASSDEILRVANATYWMAATGYDSDPSGTPPPGHYGVFKDVPASVAGANAKLDALLAAEGVEKAAIDAIASNGVAAVSVAALAAKLDAVLAGLPPAQSDAIKAELVALGKHLGVDVTQPPS